MARARGPDPQTTSDRQPGLAQYVALFLSPILTTLGYLVILVALSRAALALEPPTGVGFWHPPAGLSLALLLIFGPAYAPVALLGFLLADFLASSNPPPPVILLTVALVKTLEYAVAASFLRRIVQIDTQLRRLRDMAWFAVAALFTPLVVAASITAALAVARVISWSGYLPNAVVSWSGSAIGIVTLTPFLSICGVPWAERMAARAASGEAQVGGGGRTKPRWPPSRSTLETLAQAVTLIFVLVIVFGLQTTDRLHRCYLCFVPLIWIALRHGLPGAAIAVLTINIGAALTVPALGLEPDGRTELQVFTLALSLAGLFLGAVVAEHRETEEALRAAQGYTRNIIDSSLDIIVTVDIDRRIVEFNTAAQNAFGYRPEEVIGEHVDILYADPQESLAVYETTIREGECTREILDRRKNGEVFPAFLSASVLRDADGEIVGVMGIARDVTIRRQVEDALRESEARLHAVLENLPFDLWCIDWDGRYILQNSTCRERWGDLIGKRPEDVDIVDEDALALWQDNNRRAFAGEVVEGEVEYTIHGEKRFYYNIISPIYDRDQVRGILGINVDITERKRMEEALRRRNRELALLNRASQALVSTLDLDQVLVTVLEEVRGLLDVVACSIWLVDSATGELVCQQATGPQSDKVRGWRLAPGQGIGGWVVRSGRSLIVPDTQIDERHFKAVDQETGLELRSILTVPLQIKHSVIGVLQATDTAVNRFARTDLELLEPLAATASIAIENARLYERARRDAETKAVLLREVNHRVKNNLSAIIGFLYTERRHARAEDREVYQPIMKDLVNRVQGLATVHSMLSVSEWAPLLLTELTAQVIRSSLQTLPRNKHISVEVSPSPVRVTADQAHHLALVVNELATNTVKHAMRERDTARLTVRIEVENDAAPRTILFEFRDDGPGYPEQVLQLKRYNVGFELIQNIVRKTLNGELSLHNDHGAVASIRFAAQTRGRGG